MMEVPSSGAVYVGPTCHVQTADKRFGSRDVLDDIRAFVNEGHAILNNLNNFDDFDFENGDDDSDNDEDLVANGMANALVAGGVPVGLEHILNETPASHGDQGGNHPSFPKVARCRGNLTALSQHYNLYFAAYQDKIHIFQPQKAPQILPPPSLIMQPPQSQPGKYMGGHLDRHFGHQVNHIITGELGNLEVVLMCYDDGDVIAYYTHQIAQAVEDGAASQGGVSFSSARRIPVVKPFFHDNAGFSAWGLAIHKESRLLAVSCNKHDITVFAFSTTTDGVQFESGPEPTSESPESPRLWSGQTALELEKHFQSRTRTWRVVLPLGSRGNNIPTIAFIDDEDGNAEKVIAADISGNTWIFNIWQIGGTPVLYSPPIRGPDYQRSTGWGVMILPDSSFREVRSSRAAMGLPPQDVFKIIIQAPGEKERADIWLDITCSLHYVKDMAIDPRVFLRSRHGATYFPKRARSSAAHLSQQTLTHDGDQGSSEDSDSLDDADDGDSPNPHGFYEQAKNPAVNDPWRGLSTGPGPDRSTIDLAQEDLQGFRLARTIVPTLGQTPPMFDFLDFLEFMGGSVMRNGLINTVDFVKVRFPPHLKNFSLLRTTNADVELQSFDPRSAGVVCKDVIVNHNRRSNHIPWDLFPHISERISMQEHIADLNLVILGSLCGRVALLSLTKRRARVAGARVTRAFRVECVLPRGSEDQLRPVAALHGIAVSPVHDHRAGALRLLRPGRRPLRYRLILHYMDHTILMYDIARRSPDEDLMIF